MGAVMRSLSQAERSVVNALNAHITRNEEVSLTELALECHVAKSTVVKTLQRLGFRGYQDFSYSFRLSRDVQRGALLPRETLASDMQEASEIVHQLSELLVWCQDKKNIVFCDGKRSAALLADYVSRKLAMFDIFAPPSYDYVMVTESQLPCGLAFFFLHESVRNGKLEPVGVGEAMLETVRQRGYKTIIFTDQNVARVIPYADMLVKIAENVDPEIDLFASRVLMVFENVLAGYSRRRGEVS